jgi:hypothetical protein
MFRKLLNVLDIRHIRAPTPEQSVAVDDDISQPISQGRRMKFTAAS